MQSKLADLKFKVLTSVIKDFDNRHDDIGNKMVKACASGLCHNNNKKQPDKVFALFVQTEGRGADLGTIFILRKHLCM